MTPLSAPAQRAAEFAVARLRQGLGRRRCAGIETTIAEDGETVLVFALAEGSTVTTAVLADQIAGSTPEAFARHLEARLAR